MGKEVLMPCQVQPAFISRDIGDITYPDFIRLVNLELLIQ